MYNARTIEDGQVNRLRRSSNSLLLLIGPHMDGLWTDVILDGYNNYGRTNFSERERIW